MKPEQLRKELAARDAQRNAARAKEKGPDLSSVPNRCDVLHNMQMKLVMLKFQHGCDNYTIDPENALRTARDLINAAKACGAKVTGELEWESTVPTT